MKAVYITGPAMGKLKTTEEINFLETNVGNI
jgi:hypothetical protein